MEIGLTGHPLIPALPDSAPVPLFHLIERWKRETSGGSLQDLKCALDCLEFLERYFAGFCGGLLRKAGDSAELNALSSRAQDGPGLRRFLRFTFNKLSRDSDNTHVKDLETCFFLHGKRSLPYAHTRWLGLVGTGDSESQEALWDYARQLEAISNPSSTHDLQGQAKKLLEVLQSWIEGSTNFFDCYQHFARLDNQGWQCTVQKEDSFIEIVPPIPARLIPVEAQAPTAAPQTEDELLLESNPFSGDAAPAAAQTETGLNGPAASEPPFVPSTSQTQSSAKVTRWSAAELKSFADGLRQVYSPLDLERVPKDYPNAMRRFISSVSSGYIIVEGRQGAGKTLLTQALSDFLERSSLEVEPLTFSVKNQFYPDIDTFLEQLNEHLRIRPGTGRRSFEALDSKVIKDLNLRSPGDARSKRFATFLSELQLVNGCRIVLFLDGLDEGSQSGGQSDTLFSYLPTSLPKDVYVVVTYHPDRFRPGDRQVIETLQEGPSTQLHLSPNDSVYRDLVERFLNRGEEGPLQDSLREVLVSKSRGCLATAQHLLDGLRCQLFESPDELPDADTVYERLFERLYERVPDRYLDLFLLLATSDEPVSGDELSSLGISRTDVLELIHSLPSLFHCHKGRAIGINLAHRALRLHIQRTFLTSYAQSCHRLAERALVRLSGIEVSILPVREDLDRLAETVRRLLRWAIDSQNADFLAKVCRHELLNKLRRRIFSAMDEKGLFHRKILLLDTFAKGLRQLVEVEQLEEFREELAWALSSRALSYYHLGHYQRAQKDVETAIDQFLILVEKMNREELRNGLAAAYNRRSEIARGLEEWHRALPDAERAVVSYESVVSNGRADLTSLLMLAKHNRAIVYRSLKSFDQAEIDIEAALTGYLKLVERENRRDLRPQLAAVYQSQAALALDRGNGELALKAVSSALELLETLVHRENFEHLRNDLASVYNDRGAILYRAQALEEAERDYASAISIRTFLVAEGRIDIRAELASTYSNRGLCLVPRGEFESARESFDRAVEILDRLIETERREDLHAVRAFALNCRGSLLRQMGELEQTREDYSAAVGDYRLAVVSQGEVHSEDLAHSLNSLAEVCLILGHTAEAKRSGLRVLEIFRDKSAKMNDNAYTRERAVAHHNLGEAQRADGEIEEAKANLSQAIELLTHLVEQAGRPEHTGELATSLLRYAQLLKRQPETQLKLASRALAFFKAREAEAPHFAALIEEALLLRSRAFHSLGSPGSALDDASLVISSLEESRWQEPKVLGTLMTALLERSTLFGELQDTEAAFMDLDRCWELVDEMDPSTDETELELRRCHIILHRVHLFTNIENLDFSEAVTLLHDLDERLGTVELHLLSQKEHKSLIRRVIETFKKLRYAALVPTKTGDYRSGVERLSQLLELSQGLSPTLGKILSGRGDSGQEFSQVVQIRTQRAWAQVKLGEMEGARLDFTTVAKELPSQLAGLSPDTLEFVAEVESGLGAVLDTLELATEALVAYSRAVLAFELRPESALSPRRGTCLHNRALLLSREQRYEEALIDIQQALEIARSSYAKNELLDRWNFKAQLLRNLERPAESFETIMEALSFIEKDGDIAPACELPLQIGAYRLTKAEEESRGHLLRALRLLQQELSSKPHLWREEAGKLLAELPYPATSDVGLEVEREVARTVSRLLRSSSPGHNPLTETFLRRASRLSEQGEQSPPSYVLSANLYCLATKYCKLEFEKYGAPSLHRLVRCYVLTGRSLALAAQAPEELTGLGEGLKLIAEEVLLNPPTGKIEVEINNMSRLWLSLPPSQVLKAGASRALLVKLRRW